MNILKKIINIIKIKLLSYKNIKIYSSSYQQTFNHIYNLVSKNFKVILLAISITLQKVLFLKMKTEYISIIFIIKLDWTK